MSRKKYYENKILYSLSKIDYAKSKMAGKEHTNRLATLYFVLLNYKKVDMNTILDVTKLTRADVVSALNVLKQLGLTDWDGAYLRGNKEIRVNHDANLTFSEYVKELEKKYRAKYGKPLNKDIKLELEKVGLEPEIKSETKSEPAEDDWIEIKYSDDVIIKVKKERLKKLL